MIIRELKLENYRKFQRANVSFPEGLIGIVGANGAGKTTLLEAIAFGLFGTQMVRAGKETVKRQSAGEKEPCAVEVHFDYGGHRYTVRRELRGKNLNPNALLYRDDVPTPIAQRDGDVSDAIAKIIGMDKDTFQRSVFAKQKELNILSDLRPQERKDAVAKMLDIHKVREAINAVRSEKRGLEETIKQVRAVLKDPEKLQQEKIELEAKKNDAAAAVANAEEILQRAQAKFHALSERKKVLDELFQQFTALTTEQGKIHSRLDEKKNQEKKLKTDLEHLERQRILLHKERNVKEDVEKQKEVVEEMRQQAQRSKDKQRLAKDILILQTALQNTKTEVANTEAALDGYGNVEEQIEAIEKRIAECKKEEQKCVAQQAEGNSELKASKKNQTDLAGKIANIERLGPDAKCPTCLRELREHYGNLLEHLTNEQSKEVQKQRTLKTQLESISSALTKVQQHQATLEEERKVLHSKRVQRATLQQKTEGLHENMKKNEHDLSEKRELFQEVADVRFDEKEFEQAKKTLQQLEKRRDAVLQLEKEVERISIVTESLAVVTEAIVELEKEMTRLSKAIHDLHFDKAEFDDVQSRFATGQRFVADKEIELNDAKNEVKNLEREIAQKQKEIETEEANRLRLKKSEEEVQYLTRLESLFIDFGLNLMQRIRPLLSERASILLHQLTLGKYSRLELDEEYNIFMYDGSAQFEIDRFSGGEADLANLCLRIGISEVIAERGSDAEVKFIALDEIFGSQDQSRRQNILNAFTKLQNHFHQIFLITHIEEINEQCNCLLVRENAVGDSEAEWIR
jgi:exonuclease SbcC